MHFTDPAPVLKGAIDGILRALESAHKESTVKSFIFMSSIAAVLHHLERPEDIVFDESDWNTEAEDLLAQLGKDAPGPIIYSASKTAAEKALWKFRDEQHPAFSVTAIQPVYVSHPPPPRCLAALSPPPTPQK
jgi:nucleoside-diphosphate-sugar epimerase